MENVIDYYLIMAISPWIIILFAVIVFILYMVGAFILNKTNKIIYGKNTILAWIPFINLYLLGKLTFGKIFGMIYFILYIFISIPLLNEIIPDFYIKSIFSSFSVLTFVLWIIVIAKLFKLNKSVKKDVSLIDKTDVNNQNPMQENLVQPQSIIDKNSFESQSDIKSQSVNINNSISEMENIEVLDCVPIASQAVSQTEDNTKNNISN